MKGAYAELIGKLSKLAYKVAVDIPSGIRSDTGNVSSVAVRADMTVTFAARKLGQVLYPAADFAEKSSAALSGYRFRRKMRLHFFLVGGFMPASRTAFAMVE